jgi:peptide/nickel transport system substrate-binding protein
MRLFQVAAGIAILLVALAADRAIGSDTSGTTSGSTPGTVVVAAVDWTDFDFQQQEIGGATATMPGYDRLLAFGPDYKYVPWLADSWTVTPNSVTFHLKKGARCSDGTPVTPLVVVASFRRLVQVPKRTNFLQNYFGPGPFGIRANLKRWTFTFASETPWRNMLLGFTQAGSQIVCPAGLKALESNPRALETKMYGSGPYTLVSATHGNGGSVVFARRSNVTWGPVRWQDRPKTLTFKISPDPTTTANLLLTGDIDITALVANSPEWVRVSSTAAQNGLAPKYIRPWAPNVIVYNMFPGRVTNDLALRKALMTAVDQRAWNKIVFGGRGILTPSLFMPGSECFEQATAKLYPKPSIDAAKRVLTSAGYTYVSGNLMRNGQRVKITLIGDRTSRTNSGEYLYSQYQQLGLEIDFRQFTGPSYSQAVLGGNFDVATSNPTQPTPDAGQRIAFYTGNPFSQQGTNVAWTGRNDRAWNDAAIKGLQTLGEQSCKWFKSLQRQMLTKAYVQPLAGTPNYYFTRKGISWQPGFRNFDIAFLTDKRR